MFDDIEETRQKLIGQLNAACKALEFMGENYTDDVVDSEAALDKWMRHWNKLNTARVEIQMAGEYLHDELNRFHDRMIQAQVAKRKRDKKKAEIRAKLTVLHGKNS